MSFGIGCGLALGALALDVVWTGTGSWFDPTAWPQGALPDATNSVNVVAGSTLTFDGAAADEVKLVTFRLASTNEPAVATFEMTSGTFTPQSFLIGTAASANGRAVQRGGTVDVTAWRTDSFIVGSVAGSTGVYELVEGTLSSKWNPWVGGYGDGTLLQSGGELLSEGYLAVGRYAGATGLYEISGGTASLTNGLIVGEVGHGHAVIRGTGIVSMNRLAVNGNSELELQEGGTLRLAYAEKQTNGTGTDGRLTLDGGTLAYLGTSAVQSNFLSSNLDHVYVTDNGVTLSVPTNTTAVAQKPLEAHPDAQAGDVVKTGAGTLVLKGANTFKGKLQAQEGTVVLANESALAGYNADHLEIADGASVAVSGALPAADRQTIAARVAATTNAGYGIDTTSGDLTVAESIELNGTGGFTKTGPNTLTLTGANTWGGETRVVEGTLAAQRGVGLPAKSPLCLAGTGLWAPLADTALRFGTGAGELSVLDGASQWGFVTTTGDVTVTATDPIPLGADYTKPATLVLDAAPNTRLTLAADVNLACDPTLQVPRAGTAVVTGTVTPQGAARQINKRGAGTLAFTGDIVANADAQRAYLAVYDGALSLEGARADVSGLASANATVLLTNQTAVTSAGLLFLGNSGNSRVVQSGGSVTVTASGENLIGQYAGSQVNCELRGGTVSTPNSTVQIGFNGNAHLLQTGGRFTCGSWVGVARQTSSTAVLEVAGGRFEQNGGGVSYLSLCHAGGGDATLIVRDTGVVSAKGVGLFCAYGTTGRARVIVEDGGLLELGYFIQASEKMKKTALAEQTITVNGGTLRALTDQSCFMRLDPSIEVGADGLCFDTAGHTVGFAARDFMPTSGVMRITKQGAGTMRLVGGIPDACAFRVAAGRVELPQCDAKNGLLHRWSFEGDFTDSVGGLTATSVGTTSFNDGQVHLNTAAWNASGVRLGENVLPGDRPVTLEMWATLNASAAWNMLLDFGKSTSSHFAIVWRDTSATGPMSVILDGGGTQVSNYGNRAAEYLATPEHGKQYHFAFTFVPDGVGGTRIYVRQTDAATGALLALWQRYVTNWTLAKVEQTNCWLGTSNHKNAIGDSDYAEVRVWNRALTTRELAASVAAGPDTLPDFDFLKDDCVASSLEVAQDAVVDLQAGTLTLSDLSGAGTVTNGTVVTTGVLAPGGDGVGTLRVEGSLVVKGTLRLDAGDMIVCSGDLDLTDAQVELVEPTKWGRAGYRIPFASVGGTVVRGAKIACSASDRGYHVGTGAHSAFVCTSGMVFIVR